MVFKGATLNEKVSQKSVGKKVAEKRKAMTDAGKICNFTTTEDYKYSVAEYSYYFGINCGTCICCKKVLRIHRLFWIC